MLYELKDCTFSYGEKTILSHIDFDIRGSEKAALVGRNGAGKTTLLKILAGELAPDRDDKRQGPALLRSRDFTIGVLSQTLFPDREITVEELLLSKCPAENAWDRERYDYEKEYDRLLTGFGLSKEDKKKKLAEFSGGEQTKLALILLLLQKPDLLLLDEPTNHLDLAAAEWLETYLLSYPRAALIISHDRFFLDRVCRTVWELKDRSLTRYPGNYTAYREEKLKQIRILTGRYARQQEERKRLTELITRFKNKPTKASMARSKEKILERMVPVPKPDEDEAHIFTGKLMPERMGPKRVWEAEHLKVGYTSPLYEISMRILRGQKIALMGPNGSGKTTLLKTIAGLIPPLKGKTLLGNGVTFGYFDQHAAEIESELTVAEHYHACFPALTEKEVRTELACWLFGGREAQKTVSALSGGEKGRLVLAELLKAGPNFLILDEPTNHMDIPAKETLESAFRSYEGTILFVSHDRYFISRVAKSILLLEDNHVMYYPFGYAHYLLHREGTDTGEALSAKISAESQALIAGIRAVPKAERHRLREIPTEEAYEDWQKRLMKENISRLRRAYEQAEEELLAAYAGPEEAYAEAAGKRDQAEAAFTEALILYDSLFHAE